MVTQTDTSNYEAAMTQIRTFGYDSLGRLTAAVNPESGTQSYEYEADGLLKKKTDARGVSVTMSYYGARERERMDERVADGCVGPRGRQMSCPRSAACPAESSHRGRQNRAKYKNQRSWNLQSPAPKIIRN